MKTSTNTSPQVISLPAPVPPRGDAPTILEASRYEKFQRFLMQVAGGDLELLSRHECRHDRAKVEMAGSLLILGGIMAAISACFALMRIFDNYLVLPFGLLLGIFCFSLDRSIVVSLRRPEQLYKLLRCDVLVPLLIRVFLAVVIAICVCRPLEIKIFEAEVKTEIAAYSLRNRAQSAASAFASDPQIASLEKERQSLVTDMTNAAKHRDEAYKDMKDEDDGVLSGHQPGQGKLFRERKEWFNTRIAELQAAREKGSQRLDEIDKELRRRRADRESKVLMIESTQERSRGLLASLSAINRLSDSDNAMRWAILFVTALFLSIDLSAILTSFFSPYTAYDALLESHEIAAKEHALLLRTVLRARMELLSQHNETLDERMLEFERDLFARSLNAVHGTPELIDEVAQELRTRLRRRLLQ